MPPFRCGLPLFVLLLALAAPAQAQPVADTTSGARDAVLAVVEQLFDGMRAGDSTAVRAVFDEGARMQSISQEDGAPLIRTGSVDRFVEAVGRPNMRFVPIKDAEHLLSR